MTVLFLSHAEHDRKKRLHDPLHTKRGIQRIRVAAGWTAEYIMQNRANNLVVKIWAGLNSRTLQVAHEMRQALYRAGHTTIPIGLSPLLGLPISVVKARAKLFFGSLEEDDAEEIEREECELPSDLWSAPAGWNRVKKWDKSSWDKAGDGFVIACGTRQFFGVLRKGYLSRMASAYVLDWRNRNLSFIVRREMPLFHNN